MILLILFGGGFHTYGLNLRGFELVEFAILWLIASLLIGFSEEILFRGYFMYTLADGIGFWPAGLS
jgi:membrane protease YdiL (CAAX protease family)